MRISVKELLNLPHSSLKIGPLAGKEWYRMLEAHFKYAYENSWEVRKHFKSLDVMLAVKVAPPGSEVDEKIKTSLALQFHGSFMFLAAKKTPGDKDLAKRFAIIFCALINAACNIRQRQAEQRPFDDLIQKVNKEIGGISESLPVGFEIVK